MNLAIAVETSKHPSNRSNYKIWYLEINDYGDVIGLGLKNREELVKSIFSTYQRTGETNWRAFLKEATKSTPVEIFDFISQSTHDNTHFGNLPTLSEFQETLNSLQMNLEFRAIA